MSRTYLQFKVSEIINKYGGVRIAARELQISASYLSRLRSGEKTNPGKDIKKKLGIKSKIMYIWDDLDYL